jgi:hypothetical protein
MNPDL